MSILYAYQQVGTKWLVDNALGCKGCLLADSMGLGKSAQTIAALASLFVLDAERFFPCIVVCPASVLFHWQSECAKWGFPGKYQVAHASNSDPEHDILDCDLLITTPRGFTDAAYWHEAGHLNGLVIDEASSLKSRASRLTSVAHACADHLALRWALSATSVGRSRAHTAVA